MRKSTSNDVHHLLFQDYQFPLTDKDFLDSIAFIHYDGAAKSKRVSETIRETFRVLTSYPGFQAQYALHAQDSDESIHAWRKVIEHITLLGQEGLPFATVEIQNGPRKHKDAESVVPAKLVGYFEAELVKTKYAEKYTEWSLKNDHTFQMQTFMYEWRRILLDLPPSFSGSTWNDADGKTHLYFTQGADMQFEDERINVHVTVIPPVTFQQAVFEHTQKALTAQAGVAVV